MGYLYIDNTTQWGGVYKVCTNLITQFREGGKVGIYWLHNSLAQVCANLRTNSRMGWDIYILTTLLSGEGLRYVLTLGLTLGWVGVGIY